MSKASSRSNAAKPHDGGGVRGRDANFRSAPIHVTGGAQAKVIDLHIARQFDFSKTEQNKLPERPSTSGGPVNTSKRRNAEKSGTKDDLHFNPLGAHGSRTTFYNFPLPGSLPTPIHTPSSSPPLRTSSLPRSDTPESMDRPATNLNVPPMEIGMALGSPTHQPTNWQSQSPFESSTRNETPNSVETYVDNEAHVAAPYKQKASKWKIFGGMFGSSKKNQNGSPQAFYQLQPEGAVIHTMVEANFDNFGEPSSSEPKPSKLRGQGRAKSQRKAEKQKPNMKRAQTAPMNFEFADFDKRRVQTTTPPITLDEGPFSVHPGTRHLHGGPLLDVDIPSTQMERYSIMFGSVLQKPIRPPSSLLARRQATLDQLKTVNEEIALKEQELEERSKQFRQRRATSPQPTKSPAFSLFPNTPSQLTVGDTSSSPYRRNALQRSNTSPAALSPSRPSFAPRPENVTHATLMAPGPHIPLFDEPEKLKSKRKAKASKHTPEVGHLTSRNWSPEESHLTLDSPSGDVEEDIDDIAPIPMKPKLEEPAWQMIISPYAPGASVSGSTSSSSDHSTFTSASSISTTSSIKMVQVQSPSSATRSRSGTLNAAQRHIENSGTQTISTSSSTLQSTPASKPEALSLSTKPALMTTPEVADETEARLNSAAEVSIARQISVSRQQRQLLIPIKASSTSNLKAGSPKYHQNSPSSIRTLSPLGAVASAARAESPAPRDKNGKVGSERKGFKSGGVNERLVAASVKPATPTLVVVGSGEDEQKWSGKAMDSQVRGSGEITVGLAVGNGGSGSGLSPGEVHGHQHRKSERVVVERLSVAEV